MYNANELRIIQSLQKDIEGELNRIGLLYRFFSRTKSEDSILKNIKKNPVNTLRKAEKSKIYLV